MNSRGSTDDNDIGRPLEELAELREEPGEGFFGRIHAAINRRLTAADILDLSVQGFFATFFTYLAALFQALSANGNADKER